MKFLANSLDDEHLIECGKCARCIGEPVVSESFSKTDSENASELMKKAEMPLKCAKQLPKGVFETHNFGDSINLPKELLAEEGRILSSWNDSGWGHLVKRGKQEGYFDDQLVDGLAEMIVDRWKPEPMPTWITFVPSSRNKTLVPELADRLSKRLGIPCVPVVRKIKENAPQKEQRNRAYRAKNLDGVFYLEEVLPEDPVFLVDDIIDSGWTLTVIAALMRQRGSGPVFPIALTDASSGG